MINNIVSKQIPHGYRVMSRRPSKTHFDILLWMLRRDGDAQRVECTDTINIVAGERKARNSF